MVNYSEKALAQVCGSGGIIQEQTHLPSPFELKQALERAEEPGRRADRDLATRLATLQSHAEQARIEAERASRPSYEELVATLPAWLRLDGAKKGPLSPDEKRTFLAKYGVSEEEFNLIPDQGSELSMKPVGGSTPVVPAQSPQGSPQEPSPENLQAQGLPDCKG